MTFTPPVPKKPGSLVSLILDLSTREAEVCDVEDVSMVRIGGVIDGVRRRSS